MSLVINGVFFPLELVTQKVGYRSHEVDSDFRSQLFLKLLFHIVTLTEINEVVDIQAYEDWRFVFEKVSLEYARCIW